ncbi:MAG: nucleotide exchange factor GrpE [Hyphomicrobiaceae bacterium]
MSAELPKDNDSTVSSPSTGTGQDTKADAAAAEAKPTVEAAEVAANEPKAYVDPAIATEAKIAELENQVAEMKDRYLRAYADSDNLRKRTEREKADISKYAVTNFARDMVAISDNLRRAIEAVGTAKEEQSSTMKALVDGVVLTDQELQKALEKHGVRQITAKGEIFDPHKHQAVMEQDDPSVAAGTILQVFQEGYEIGERVLRPSMVVVAKGGAKPIKSTEAATNLEPPPAANDTGDADTSAAQAEESGAKSKAEDDAPKSD